ncbi:tetratricopeptide repeat protein [Undibacterium sp.]|uniref:tetratricopeptide repeat protein n=1 Tax=Undibacterium sp. TaxID=1914977 RepID=UPI0025D1B401|nr:tetratricopeptide repeat protein [Undibacterium sp.]
MNYRKFFLKARPSLIFSFVSMLLLACGLGFASITYFNASPTPSSAQIESAGVLAINAQTPAAMANLSQWAQQGMPVAQRELGLVLASAGTDLPQAVSWLNKAALAGDNEAQFVLAEAHYKAKLGVPQNYALAWKWYAAAAMQENTKASFMLARMAKYGEGAPLDLALSVHYLQQASEAGNAQAMFLLSNAYAVGEGVAKNADLAQKWLEKSAEGDYPVAIHELALSLTANQDQAGENALAARHLIKEANDERSLRWNRYQ